MVWVFGIGIGLLLLFTFPRQMLALVLVLAAAAGGLLWFEHRKGEENRRRIASISLSASFDVGRCSTEFPILVGVRNGYTETLQSLTFSLVGYREGFSSPVYSARSVRSDRIIRPGETYDACWQVPQLDYGARPAPPETLRWRATPIYTAFGGGP